MKKVLAATFVVALMAVTITGASADPAERLVANAYSADLGGSLLPGLLEKQGDVTATLPPGTEGQDDILTADLSALLEGVGTTQAQAHTQSDISDEIVLRQAGFTSPGAGGSAAGSAGLLGDLLSGGGSGGLLSDVLGGATGGGLPVGGLSAQSTDGGGTVQAQQVGGLPVGGSGGLLGDFIGGEGLLGDVLGSTGPDVPVKDFILSPSVNGRGFSSVSLTGVLPDSGGTGGGTGGGGVLGSLLGDLTGGVTGASEGDGSVVANQLTGGTTGEVISRLVFDAVLRLGLIEAEAVVTCAGNTPVYEVASRLAESQGSTVDIGDTLNDLLGTVTDTLTDVLPAGLVDIQRGQQGSLPGGGVFVNALHVTVGGEITDPTAIVPTDPTSGLPVLGDLLSAGGTGDEPLIDLVLAHAEVDGTVCAAAAAPPAIQQPTGDAGPSLPRTGGGLGLLPAVLTLGLLGAAVTGGRVALRSRRSANSSTL